MHIPERQLQIIKMVRNVKYIKITDLSRLLEVSEMVIQQDVKSLLKEGIISKNFDGISLAS